MPSVKLVIGNLFALTSLGTFATCVTLSIASQPVTMSVLWLIWVFTTGAAPFWFPTELDQPLKPPPVPFHTLVIQHPDESLDINLKSTL